MHILVTGASGFLGQRLVATLASRPGVRVRALVHRHAAAFPAGVEAVTASLDDRDALRAACDDVTHVAHLAGLDQAACERNRREALMVSGEGTLNVTEAAAAAGARRVIYISTYQVYGLADARPTLHEDAPLQPTTMYGVSRVTGEACARMVGTARGLDVVVLRLANGFGAPAEPAMPAWKLVVNDLCWRAVHDGEMVLRGSGRQQRDFIPLTDSVAAIEYFVRADLDASGDRTFNIGSGGVRTLLAIADDVAQEYRAMFGRDVPLRTGTDTTAEPPMRPLDTQRALQAGFRPRLDVRAEIRGTLAAAAAARSATATPGPGVR